MEFRLKLAPTIERWRVAVVSIILAAEIAVFARLVTPLRNVAS